MPADTLEASPLATNTATEPVHLKLKLFVTETVNAVISSSGEVSKMLIVGEVGLALDGSLPSAALPQQTRFNLFFKDDDAIEKVVANATYCADAEDSARCFPCNLGSIISYAPSETSLLPLLKYQVRVQDSELDKFAPLGIRTRWKADSSQTSLMLLYQYPGEALGSLPLTGVDVLVSLAGTADVASVQCKPNGPWNKDRRMLLWRLGDVQPTGEEPGKLMARFDTGASPIVGDGATSPGDSSAAQLPPGPINVRFSCNGALLSRTELGAALADGNEVLATVEVTEVRKQVVAGKYVVLP